MLRNIALPPCEHARVPPARASLVDVFITHRPRLKRAAQDILGDAASAEDLVHDACLKALAQPADAPLEPLPYALRMVRNMAIDRYRRAALEGRLFDRDDDVLDVAAAGSPEGAAIERQHLQRVVRVLATLPERTRRVFELCRLEGRSQREIAEAFGISPAMVHLLLHDALERCRAACAM